MESILYVSTEEITVSQLQDAVQRMGGKWDDEPTLRHGVLTNGDATLFLNSPKAPSVEYDDEEIGELAEQLGSRPRTVICIDIGHSTGSFEFAVEVGEKLVGYWRGIIDDNGIFDE